MFFSFITVLSWLGRRPIGDWSATSRGPVSDRSATSCIKSQRGPHEVADQSPISRQPVPDKSPTSRRPTAKPSCDCSATSAIVLNFGRGEVVERLQCMSDLGLTYPCPRSSHRLLNKLLISGARSGVSDELWDKNVKGWRTLGVATQERKARNMEIEIVKPVVNGSTKLTVPRHWQEQIQVGSRSVALRRVFDLNLSGIYLVEILLKVWVIIDNY